MHSRAMVKFLLNGASPISLSKLFQVLTQRFFFILDINECLRGDFGGCDDICLNSEGSYNCSCRDGLNLADDGTSCMGKF